MATKLKNLKIKKVDFVDEGANPDAYIRLFKRKDGEPDGGQEPETERNPKLLGRVFGALAKAFSTAKDFDSALEAIEKGDATSFNEEFAEVKHRKIMDEIWDICYALQSSFCSVLCDESLDGAASEQAMLDSLDEFETVIKDAVKQWSSGKAASVVFKEAEVSAESLEMMKSARERLDAIIEKAADQGLTESGPQEQNTSPKGEEREMKIDKSKLTEAELAFLNSIEKRYGTEEAEAPAAPAAPAAPEAEGNDGGVAKSAAAAPAATGSAAVPAAPAPAAQEADASGDIYKGLHPAVKAEMEALRKFREQAEERELREIAKKYVIIGKKEDELVPMLKGLRAAGGTAYDDMIAILDQTVSTVEKSGVFGEIGKSGGHGDPDGGAWAEADKKAVDLMKSKAGLTKAQALDEVFMADPELAARCEKEE